MPRQVEYRVIPVTRYLVTQWYHEDHGDGRCEGGSESYGEFEWDGAAYFVANSIGQNTKLKHPDWDVKYPEIVTPTEAPSSKNSGN